MKINNSNLIYIFQIIFNLFLVIPLVFTAFYLVLFVENSNLLQLIFTSMIILLSILNFCIHKFKEQKNSILSIIQVFSSIIYFIYINYLYGVDLTKSLNYYPDRWIDFIITGHIYIETFRYMISSYNFIIFIISIILVFSAIQIVLNILKNNFQFNNEIATFILIEKLYIEDFKNTKFIVGGTFLLGIGLILIGSFAITYADNIFNSNLFYLSYIITVFYFSLLIIPSILKRKYSVSFGLLVTGGIINIAVAEFIFLVMLLFPIRLLIVYNPIMFFISLLIWIWLNSKVNNLNNKAFVFMYIILVIILIFNFYLAIQIIDIVF